MSDLIGNQIVQLYNYYVLLFLLSNKLFENCLGVIIEMGPFRYFNFYLFCLFFVSQSMCL